MTDAQTPDTVFPWPQAGGAYRADPITGELTPLSAEPPVAPPSPEPEQE